MKIDIHARLPGPKQRVFARSSGQHFLVKSGDDALTIDLYDEIGPWGVTAREFRARLRESKASSITVRINSPGGDVFDGIAMHNDLIDHPAKVRVEITGVAASAASIVAMAGDRIAIADNAFLMIHNAWGIAAGDKQIMTDFAAVLTQIDAALVRTYAARTGLDEKRLAEMMTAETWLSGSAAVADGFADETTAAEEVSARFDMSVFKNVPRDVPRLSEESGEFIAALKRLHATVQKDTRT